MATNWQPVQIPTGVGIDTKTDEKRLPLENVADLQNIVFTDAPGWRIRNGYTSLDLRQFGSSTKVTGGLKLGVRNNELLQFDDSYAYSYSESSERWKQLSELVGPAPSIDPLLDQPVDQSLVDTFANGGIRITAWVEGTVAHYQITDDNTGMVIVSDTTITGASKVRCIGVNQSLHIIYYRASAASLSSKSINISEPSTVTTTELVTDVHTDALFDVAANVHTNSGCFVVYKENVTNEVAAFILSDPGTHAQNITDIGVAAGLDGIIPGVLSVNAGSDGTQAIFTVFAAESGGTDAVVNQFDSNINPLNAPVQAVINANCVNAQAISNSTSTLSWWYNISSGNSYDYMTFHRADAPFATAFGSGTSSTRHCSIASKPFIHNGRAFCLTAHESTLQSKYFLTDASGNVSCRLLDGIGTGNVDQYPSSTQYVSGVCKVALGIRKRLTIDESETVEVDKAFSESGAKLITLDFADNNRYRSVQAGETLYVLAGMLHQYDGVNVKESGFNLFPENVTAASNDTISSNLNNGETYNYRVYYEYTNNAGERQRSTGVSISHTLVAPTDGTGTITLTIPTLAHSSQASDVSIVVFRTEGNASVTAGAPFYRITDPDPTNNTGNNRYIPNLTSADSVELIDNISDDTTTGTLTKRELDYQNTGELDNVAPPASNVLGYGKSRVWVGYDNLAYFSKLRQPGDAVEFHDGNYVVLPDEGGDVTAIAEMKHFVVLFKKDRIYAVSGEGPDNLGRGFFNLPQLVTADVGCVNQDSVVRYDKGILFKSDKGIYQIGNNLDIQYIGAQVEAYNDLTITGATVVNDTNQIRFLTSDGRTLVYDYLFQRWSTFTNHAGCSSALWNETYVYLRCDTGKVFKESESTFTDDGSGYGWLVRSAHFGLAGPLGYQRVRHLHMLGEYYSAHDIQVRCNYNNNGFTEKATYDPTGTNGVSIYGIGAYGAGAYGGSGSPNYEARFNLPVQKCRTVQFEISCLPTVGGRSCEIDAMAVFAGVKFGNNKLADARTFGE